MFSPRFTVFPLIAQRLLEGDMEELEEGEGRGGEAVRAAAHRPRPLLHPRRVLLRLLILVR